MKPRAIHTFSIVAYDPSEPAWGVAVASKFLAVGAVVPWARAGAGAVATQAFANTTFGPGGLALMEQGHSAEEALNALLAQDTESGRRQVGMVDAHGGAATFTGEECHDWAGGVTGAGYAVQGNLLTGPEVVEAMAEAFTQTPGRLPDRLYAALLAGDRAGGDRRGRQSAAILVVKDQGGYGGFNDRWIDYRVDNHPDPVPLLNELLRLHILHNEVGSPETQVPLQGETLKQLQLVMQQRGFYRGELHGEYDTATRDALAALVLNENLKDRTHLEAGTIDAEALKFLLTRASPSERC